MANTWNDVFRIIDHDFSVEAGMRHEVGSLNLETRRKISRWLNAVAEIQGKGNRDEAAECLRDMAALIVPEDPSDG